METVKNNINNSEIANEIGMEERIKSGEEIEVTKAVEILLMLKENHSFEEISKKTGRPISDVIKIKKIFNA